MFYSEGLVDFASEKSFIPKLPFFLLHRWVQKWLFAKYCPHFSFITLVLVYYILKPKNDDQLEFIPTYLSYNLQCSK